MNIAHRFIPIFLLTACSDPAAAPLDLQTCDPAESPTELLRLEGVSTGRPVDAFDLGKAVSLSYALERDAEPGAVRVPLRYSLVDNCGGSPLHLPETFGLSSGAANVGGEIVLCGSDDPLEDKGVWELMADGSRGQDLGLGDRCMGDSFPFGVREASLGIVYDEDDVGVAVTQFMPDGITRLIADPGTFDFVFTSDGLAIFSFGDNAAVYPPDGSAPIDLDLPEAVYSVYPTPYPAPGGAASDGWVLVLPRGKARGGERPDEFPPVPGYAVDLRTGAWFQTPEVVLELRDGSTEFSLRDGLLATDGERGIELSRAGWDRHLPLGQSATVFAVLDAQRVFVVGTDGVQILQIPLLLPEEGTVFEPEVMWSRPLDEGDEGGEDEPSRGAGFAWSGMVLAVHTVPGATPLAKRPRELWAYPMDGRPAFSFVPESTHLYFGSDTVTGIGFRPDSNERDLWLFQRSVDGEFDVIADDLASGQNAGGLLHPWTPELGRILYSVRDGDAVSVRQHVLAP